MVLESTFYNVESGTYMMSDTNNIYVEPLNRGTGHMDTNSP